MGRLLIRRRDEQDEQLGHYVEDCKQEFNIEPQIIITDHADKLNLQGVAKIQFGKFWQINPAI